MIKKLFLIILFLFLAPALCIADTATRVPTGDEGFTGSWTARDGGLYYVEVDDPVGNPDDLTSCIYCTSVGRITFSFSSFSIIPGSTITQVCVYWRHTKAAGPASTFGPVLKVGGNYYTGTEVSVGTSWTTSDSITVGSQWTQNPKTSSDWTVDDINGIGSNALEAFGVHSTYASPNPYCTQVYVEVTYTPAPPVPTITVASAISQPPHVVVNSTGIVVGAASVVRNIGTSQVTAVTLKENGGTIDAENGLANIELWLSSDTIRDAGDNQLETAKSFNGIDGECTFTETFEVGTTTQYLIVRLDVTSGATAEETIEIQVSSITTTSNVYGIPCDISGTTTVTDNWWSEGGSWSYRKKLVFDNSDQTENLTDFPVMVKLTPTRINYSDVGNADGTDLRFIDSDNSTELKYHIEEWNSSGDSIIWVKVPQIDGSSNIDFIYMYYGNSGASDVQDSSGTFSNNYVAVWHMDESSWSGTPDEVKDATQYTNDGQAFGNATTTDTAKLNGGGILDGTGDYVDVQNHSSLQLTTEFTFAMWIYRETDSGTHERLLAKSDADSPDDTDRDYYLDIQSIDVVIVGSTQLGDASAYLSGNAIIYTGTWYYIVAMKNSTEYIIYVNGAFDASGVTGGTIGDARQSTMPLNIGRLGQAGTWYYDFDGIIDEVRISTGTRSADWVAAQYESMNDTFINVGSKVESDTTAPEAITNLSGLTWTSEGEVKLTWSAPGDDGWNNPIYGGKYGVKWSTYSSFDWGGADNFNLEWSTSTSPGNSESKVITGLDGGTTYYFRIWTADEVPNWSSGLSNGATAMAKIVVAANRYWVGVTDPDNWNDPNNWSATSGGTGNAGVPGADDTAIFDGGNTYSCQIDISSTVASVIIYSTYTATISINSGESLTTSGSFEIAGGTFTTNGEILDAGSYNQTGGIFNAGGSTVTCNGNFSVTVGTFNAGVSILVLDGTDGNATFTGDGYTFNNVIFQSTGTVARTWTLGGGTITFNGDFQLKAQGSADLTVTAITNNPDLNILGSVDYTGTGGGTESLSMGEGTWTVGGNVNFSDGTVDASTSTFVLNGSSTQTLTMDGNNLNILQITNSSSDGVYFADNLSLSTFTATTGDTNLYFCGGSTFTFTNIDFNGQPESSRIVLKSTSTGTAWYFTVTGNQSVSYVDVRDSDASGGNTIDADDGTNKDSGNNVNWDFEAPGDRYWVASSAGNWKDPDNWSTSSGGAPPATVPSSANKAIFDGAGLGSCSIDINASVTDAVIYSTYTAAVSINTSQSLTTSSSFSIAGGTFTTNGEILDVGSYTQTGGIFNAGGSTVTCNGNFSVTVGTFNAGASVLVLDVTDGDATFTGDGYTFNNVIFQSTTTVARTWTLGGGTITINGDFQFKAQGSGNLTVTAVTNNPDLDIGGSVDYTGTGAGTELVSMGDGTWTVGGNIDFSGGTVDASTSTFVLNGTSTQTLTMDGNSLNILQITNSSSDGVYFADSLTLSTFTATTGNTRLYFCGGSTFTFTNIDFDGQSESSRIVLKSTSTNTAWYLTVTGTQSVSYVDVEDSDASGGDTILAIDGTSLNSGNNVKWDFGPPAAITDLTGLCDSDTGDVTLSWSTPGDDDWTGTLPSGSKYIIDYSTYSIQWSTTNYKVSISTSGVAPHTEVSHTITGLTGNSTYYFRIWTRDEVPTNWSGLSNGATVWVNPVLSVTIDPSSRPFGEVDAGQSDVLTDGFTVENTGNITQKYQLRLTGVPTEWTAKNVAGAPEWEQAKILGLFTTQSPLSATHFNDNPPDTGDGDIVRTTTDDQATSTNFAISEEGVEVKGYNVTVGGIRYLWFRFDAPSGTSITNEQFLTVTVTAIQQ
ncbi:hypothetical protein ES707_02677 [subsurface metagenome]